ncbi:MAG: hypothetical protein V3U27_20465, partial [Candidatus Tectomicrobia bacterium]
MKNGTAFHAVIFSGVSAVSSASRGATLCLVKYVEEFTRIRPLNGLRHKVFKGVVHGAGFGMPGVKKHQYQ